MSEDKKASELANAIRAQLQDVTAKVQTLKNLGYKDAHITFTEQKEYKLVASKTTVSTL